MSMPLWPTAASVHAGQIDLLFLALLALVLLLSAPVFVLLIAFALHYSEGRDVERREPVNRNLWLEVSWAAIPFALSLVFFFWAAALYADLQHPPEDALPIEVVAKQWMWKTQHPDGQREINELHVPQGRPVVLNMTSQDVIHSLYFPALRIKQDVLPGRTTRLWFEAEEAGTYHLLCTEFCGTSHSEMRGQIVVLPAAAYEDWLERQPLAPTLAERGAQLYRSLGCSGCHEASDVVRAPPLEGVFGSPVPLMSGEVIVADEAYIRDSILLPRKDVVAGYEPLMPSFRGRIEEEQLIQLVAYIKSLATAEEYRP
ncbi:MAG: cytochrome c oxidase subunit II [Geminicoccaceae bacterium]|nr:cytochrome c oxidase subunit II [Geminicoccaceae bacterium]